jgi:hypothetical protein
VRAAKGTGTLGLVAGRLETQASGNFLRKLRVVATIWNKLLEADAPTLNVEQT